ncbi:putative nuclease HARBI1 [Pecten maximus]|uniref:putative nuclease HARBI1 n=1 Tax=Pecten maximus TaxID=6579 RepID=UPI001457E637|nr:putative nuclease HARBI1 [Pecten maximus]
MAMNLLFDILGEEGNRVRRPRVHYDRSSPLADLNDDQLRARYRFGRAGIEFIIGIVRDRLEYPTKRSNALSVEMQVLIALRFYATGTFQQVVGDTIMADKSTVSRVIRKVSEVLSSLIPQFIKWPVNRQDKLKIQQGFYQHGGFPGVVGSIDGTHIRIQAPTKDEPNFVNRKGYHSINVQAVCDHEENIGQSII